YTVNLRAADGRIGRVLGNYGVTELPTARSMIECLLMGEKGTSLAKYPELELIRLDSDGAEVREDFHHALTGYYFRHQLKGMHYGEFANYADYFARCIIENSPNSPDLVEVSRPSASWKPSASRLIPAALKPSRRSACRRVCRGDCGMMLLANVAITQVHGS